MMRYQWTVWLALGVALSGCQRDGCTDIGCFDGFEVRLVPPLEDGEATIEVEGDLTTTCTQNVGEPSGACNEKGIVFILDSQERLQMLKLYGVFPAHVGVRVTTEGTLRRHAPTTALEYTTVQPNGSGCAPVCRSASLDAEAPP